MAAQQRLRGEEIPRRIQTIILTIEELLSQPVPDWSQGYCNLLTPPSQAVSLQWVYRDGQLVNLPVSLLVEGDIIALRPGLPAPTELRGIQRLLQPQLFRVTKTPTLETVTRCLEDAQKRPVSVLDNERFAVQTLLERGLAPLTLMLLLLLNLLRFLLGSPGVGPWPVALLQTPVNGTLPLLPLTFPLLWLLVNVYGEVRVLNQLVHTQQDWWEMMRETGRKCVCVLRGRHAALCFTSSLLHSLGSVTVSV
ncbi:transmembrane protein 94-like [Hypomesus transpacificus]|uniref:transmembrane protein 94-like n=1 Tax=Hypomesus transpacificus TaxID=137520 RepID=UPI001F075B66|nr:transmembrane protein 94-like [Hypomesus transpacificus]